MKKYTRIISAACSAAAAISMIAFTPSAAGNWKDAYADFLEDQMNVSNEDASIDGIKAFSVCDLNADGTPELIFSEADFHAAACDIYTYSGGKLVSVGTAGSYGECGFMPEAGYVTSGYVGMGYTTTVMLKMSGNSLKEVKRLEDDAGNHEDPSEATYTIDEKEVSQKKYEDLVSKLNEYFYIPLGRTFKLNSQSIDYAVRGVSDYKTAYRDFLSSGVTYYSDDVAFSCCDITGDKVPELSVRDSGITYFYTFSDGRIQYYSVDYSYLLAEGDEILKIGISADKKYLMVCMTSPQNKACCYSFYKIKKDHLECIAYMSYDENYMTGKYEYMLNGKKTTKSKFNKALKMYSKYSYKSFSKEYSLTAGNIKKVFG